MSPEPNEAPPGSVNRSVPNQAGQGLYAPTAAEQRTARIMGAWFLGTFIAIPAFFFYDPILNHADYVVGSGADLGVAVGALLEILLAVAGIATAGLFDVALQTASAAAGDGGPHRWSVGPSRRSRRAVGGLGYNLGTSRRPHSARGHLGVLAECLAPR
jgi:hypothetical protein